MAALIQLLAVAQHLSFHRAAIALNVSQSTVSTRIRALEQDLGVALFERTTRGVRLTEVGSHFVDLVSKGVDQIGEAVSLASLSAQTKIGSLRIGLDAMSTGSRLAQAVARFSQEHPNIGLVLAEVTATEAHLLLCADQLDIAFVFDQRDPGQFHRRTLWSETLWAALPRRHPLGRKARLKWSDLAGCRVLLRSRGSGPHLCAAIQERFGSCASAPSINCIDVAPETLVSLVGQGLGITLLLASDRPAIHGIKVLPLADEPKVMTVASLWRPGNQRPALQSMLALLRQHNEPT